MPQPVQRPIAGVCDSGGNASITIDGWAAYWIVGSLVLNIDPPASVAWKLADASGLPLGSASGPAPNLGEFLVSPGASVTLTVTGGAPAASITGRLVGTAFGSESEASPQVSGQGATAMPASLPLLGTLAAPAAAGGSTSKTVQVPSGCAQVLLLADVSGLPPTQSALVQASQGAGDSNVYYGRMPPSPLVLDVVPGALAISYDWPSDASSQAVNGDLHVYALVGITIPTAPQTVVPLSVAQVQSPPSTSPYTVFSQLFTPPPDTQALMISLTLSGTLTQIQVTDNQESFVFATLVDPVAGTYLVPFVMHGTSIPSIQLAFTFTSSVGTVTYNLSALVGTGAYYGQVDVRSMPDVTATLATGTAVEILDGGGVNKLAVDAAGDAQVDVVSLPSLPAGGNTIGSVDIGGTLPAFAATPTVDVGNFPATQPVSGTVTADQGGAPWSTTDTNDGAAGTGIAPPTGGSGFLGFLSGIYNALLGTLKVSVQNASIAVTGTFWQATQPVSGTVTAAISSLPSGANSPAGSGALTLTTGFQYPFGNTVTSGVAYSASISVTVTSLTIASPGVLQAAIFDGAVGNQLAVTQLPLPVTLSGADTSSQSVVFPVGINVTAPASTELFQLYFNYLQATPTAITGYVSGLVSVVYG